MNINGQDKKPTFEEACAKAEFSQLISLVLALTDAVLRLWARLKLRYGRSHFGSRSQANVSQTAPVGGDPST